MNFLYPYSALLYLLTIDFPLRTFFRNSNEIWFGLYTILIPLLSVYIICFIVGIILIKKIEFFRKKNVTCAAFLVLIVVCIEGFYIPYDYKLLTGNESGLSANILTIILDAILWISFLIAFVLVLIKKLNINIKIVKALSVSIFASSFAGLILAVNIDDLEYSVPRYLNENGINTVGNANNIVVFIMDATDIDIFQEIIKRDDELRRNLSDFTLYDNITSSYNYTRGAIPSILTGYYNDNSHSYKRYIELAYRDSGLLGSLKKSNYDNRLFTYDSMLPLGVEDVAINIDNITQIGHVDSIMVTFMMIGNSMFRCIPYPLKSHFDIGYNAFTGFKPEQTLQGVGLSRNDKHWIEKLKTEGLSTIDGNAFRFIHLRSAHTPIEYDENLNEPNRNLLIYQQRLRQAHGSFRGVAEYLRQLKLLKKYDDSMIFILADHGSTSDPSLAFYQRPLFLVKNVSDKSNRLSINNSPVSNIDLNATILRHLGADLPLAENYDSKDIYTVYKSNRVRRYFYFNPYEQYDENYLPPLNEFNVMSNNASPDSFTRTGHVYFPGEIKERSYPNYKYGNEITVGDIVEKSSSFNHMVYSNTRITTDGFGELGNFVLLSGLWSNINLSLSRNSHPYYIFDVEASISPFIAEPQQLYIKVNGKQLNQNYIIQTPDYKLYRFIVPNSYVKVGLNEIKFNTPDSVSFKNNGVEFKHSLRIIKLNLYNPGKLKNISFGSGNSSNSTFFQIKGWFPGELSHTWSERDSTLYLPLDTIDKVDLKITTLFPPPKNTEIFINDKSIGIWKGDHYQEGNVFTKTLEIPKSALKGPAPTVRFLVHTHDAAEDNNSINGIAFIKIEILK